MQTDRKIIWYNDAMRDNMGTFLVDYQDDGTGTQAGDPIEATHPSRSRSRSRKQGTMQVVEFILGDELFAIDLFDTREVINTTDITPLPGTASFIHGIIDLRGVITTIIDLKEMMKISKESSGKKKSRIIVLDSKVSEKMVGILVDDVLAVTTYQEDVIDHDTQATSMNERDILGIIRKKRKIDGKEKSDLIIWLDIREMVRKIEQDI